MGKTGRPAATKRRAKGEVIKARANQMGLTQDRLIDRTKCSQAQIKAAWAGKEVSEECLELLLRELCYHTIEEISDLIEPSPSSSVILEAARDYLTHNSKGTQLLCKLLGLRDDTAPEKVADRILDVKDPLQNLWDMVIGKIHGETLSALQDEERETIRQFRDYGTMLVLPPKHMAHIMNVLHAEENGIKASTTDKPLVVLHLALALRVVNTSGNIADMPGKLIERNGHQFIAATVERVVKTVPESPDRGVSVGIDEFVQGLAWHLEIPSTTKDTEKAINRLLNRYAGHKEFPIRIAVLYSETQSTDIEKLKKRFSKLLFIQLPKQDDEV